MEPVVLNDSILSQFMLKDDAIALLALRNLINSSDSATIKITQEGQSDTTLQAVLSNTSLIKALDMTKDAMNVSVTVDVDKLSASMKRIKLIDTEQNYFEWAIAKGASNSLLVLLFPALADSSVIAQLRKVLCPDNTGFTRRVATIKSLEVQAQIHEKWQLLNQSIKLSLFEKLRALHGHFHGEYELNMLYAVLKEYEDL